jgi:hypothetical protein
MGLSEFPDTLSPVILHFGGDIGDKSPCGEFSLITDLFHKNGGAPMANPVRDGRKELK